MAKTSTSFKPGHPNISPGRPPKEWTMKALYKQAGEEADETGEPKNLIVARKLWELAKGGDVVAIKEINNRIDGQSPQYIEQDLTVRDYQELSDEELVDVIKQKGREAGTDSVAGREEA